jgi:glycerol-3-phosphate dehydrogenase (NAD(P)+)
MRVTVVGSGSWGTALTILLARNGHDVTLLGRDPEEIDILQRLRENLRYLPGFVLPESARAHQLAETWPEAELVVLAVPSGAVREIAGSHCPQLDSQPLLVASKGLEAGTAKLMTEVVQEACPKAEVGVISGPNLAIEIVRGIPTAAVVAFTNQETADRVRQAFACASFRAYRSADVLGVELAGALKNVLAIGAGMSDGLGFGDNTKGALLARGLRETLALGVAMGARFETFVGIAGVGDLIATASSVLSRNYRVGLALGKGETLAETVQKLGQVAEGVPTSEAVIRLAKKFDLNMPVFEAIDAVLRGRLTPQRGVAALMERATPEEGIALPNQTPGNLV